MEIDTGVVMKDARLETNAVVYIYDLDENYYDIESFGAAESIMKNDIGIAIKSMKSMINAMIKTNRELIYKYIGNQSGRSYSIVFSVPELENILNQ